MKDTCIEYKGKSVHDVPSTKFSQTKEGKEKGKCKHQATMRNGEERPTCSHCQKKGNEDEKFRVMHL